MNYNRCRLIVLYANTCQFGLTCLLGFFPLNGHDRAPRLGRYKKMRGEGFI